MGVRELNGERLCREAMRRENNLNFGFFPQGVNDLVWEKLRTVVKNVGFG